MMIDHIPTTIGDSRDPQGIERLTMPGLGAVIKIENANPILENARKYTHAIELISEKLQRIKGITFKTFDLKQNNGNDSIFSFFPTKDMTSMIMLDPNGAAFYKSDDTNYSGKELFEIIEEVASQLEMSAGELYRNVAPLFYTRTNSHQYYLIQVPQN